MIISANYVNKGGYLLVEVLVPWTEENAKRVVDESQREATKRGHVRLLFDLRNWAPPEMEYTRFASGAHLAQVLGPPFKVAAYALPEGINRFGEDTARNRGALFRIFPDERSALHWLVEDTTAESPPTVPAAVRASRPRD